MLHYDLQDRPDGLIVAIAGDLDTAAAHELDGRLEAIVGTLDGDLIVDLERLSYLNSTGVRSFIRLEKLVKQRGFGLRFRGVSERILRIFRYCGLDSFFAFEPAIGARV